MNNPVLRKFTTLFSNIEKTNLTLNKDIRYNISCKSNLIFSSILDTYKQYAIVQIIKLVVNMEILGSPVNLIKSLGTGVKDFFHKPAKGIIKGPLEGVKGFVSGTKSLVKNALGGALNTVSKITSGFSKEILLISQDENYINEREKKNMMDKPKNIIEGIGYGISSMMSGIFYGVTDVVRKPLEGAKKENLKGFGKGVVKGLGSLVAKPVSGIVDLISKTTMGIKNTMNLNDEEVSQQRYARPFYGKFKSIRIFNSNDAAVIYFINKVIPYFQKKLFSDFVGTVTYSTEKRGDNILVFGVNEVYLIGIERFELILNLPYDNVKSVQLDDNSVVIIEFRKKVNGNKHTTIKIKEDRKRLAQNILKLFNEVLSLEV
jgi:vacuolar protein sorting-associated protein 13A/C